MGFNKSKTKVKEFNRTKEGKMKYCIQLGKWINPELNKTNDLENNTWVKYTVLFSREKNCQWLLKQREYWVSLAQPRKVFLQKSGFLTSNIDLNVWKSVLKLFVWRVDMYDSETWTISQVWHGRIEAFEMWYYKRICRINW